MTADGTHEARLLQVEGRDVTLEVREGKHRMVRRMLANLGLPVTRLIRVRFGDVELGALPPGSWRPLAEDQICHNVLPGVGDSAL
jgi:pseudouridine synthase